MFHQIQHQLDSCIVEQSPLFTITNLLPKNVGNWSPAKISVKEVLDLYNPDISEEIRKLQERAENVFGGKHVGIECTILRPQLLKHLLTVTRKSSQIYPEHLRRF